ncbi:MAG: serine/threonine-protein phosphatase, partial [Phycisphaerales bacterium]|nr:serine/threonine-protein phosphatase [Phycisphaerales bacterium]
SELRVARRFQGGLRGEIDKIHEELQLAASVQREFLPRKLPQADTVDIQLYYRPAGYVSGDIYDVQKLDDHHLGFFVADAVGHGVPAALMTMVLLRSLTTTVPGPEGRTILPPGAVLENLNNEMILRHGDVPRFATAAYGIVDTRDRTVTIAGAGHPAPVVLGPDGTRAIETSGGLLGVFPEATFDEAEFVLQPDDMLIIYSDGFETAFPGDGADDYARRVPSNRYMHFFRQTAETWRADNLRAAMDELAGKLNAQSGSLHQIDDLTALVLVPARTTPLDRLFRGQAGKGAHAPKEPDHAQRIDQQTRAESR